MNQAFTEFVIYLLSSEHGVNKETYDKLLDLAEKLGVYEENRSIWNAVEVVADMFYLP
jgi:hypothetical protein